MMNKLYTSRQLYAIVILGSLFLLVYGFRAWKRYEAASKKISAGGVWAEIKGNVRKPGVYSVEIGENTLKSLVEKAGGLEGVVAKRVIDEKLVGQQVNHGDSWMIEILPGGALRTTKKRIKGAKALALGLKMQINSASETDLLALPLMTQNLARKIVRYREKRGQFRSFKELMEVPGVTERRLNRWKQYLSVGSEEP